MSRRTPLSCWRTGALLTMRPTTASAVLNMGTGHDDVVVMMSEVREILSMLEGMVSLLDNIEENEALELGNDDTLKAAADQFQDQLVLVNEKSKKPGRYQEARRQLNRSRKDRGFKFSFQAAFLGLELYGKYVGCSFSFCWSFRTKLTCNTDASGGVLDGGT